jgi:hypothetical protein
MASDGGSDDHECLFACWHHKNFYTRYFASEMLHTLNKVGITDTTSGYISHQTKMSFSVFNPKSANGKGWKKHGTILILDPKKSQ